MSDPTYAPDDHEIPEVPAEVAHLLRSLEVLSRLRVAFMAGLFGSSRSNPVRERLMRLVLLCQTERRIWRLKDYQEALKDLASPSAVREEILLMVERGLVTLRPDPKDGRVRRVHPTAKLVVYVATYLPPVVASFLDILRGL